MMDSGNDNIVFFVLVFCGAITASFGVGFIHGKETYFERCLKANQHMVYSEAIKACGVEVR